jgi:hypothetical protein
MLATEACAAERRSSDLKYKLSEERVSHYDARLDDDVIVRLTQCNTTLFNRPIDAFSSIFSVSSLCRNLDKNQKHAKSSTSATMEIKSRAASARAINIRSEADLERQKRALRVISFANNCSIPMALPYLG